MTIYTKEGKRVDLKGADSKGKSHSLYIYQGAKIDMTELKIRNVTTIGKASVNENSKAVTLTCLEVNGLVKFSDLKGDTG